MHPVEIEVIGLGGGNQGLTIAAIIVCSFDAVVVAIAPLKLPGGPVEGEVGGEAEGGSDNGLSF